jgi:diguanylate cyclase (GGDEF)-like protein
LRPSRGLHRSGAGAVAAVTPFLNDHVPSQDTYPGRRAAVLAARLWAGIALGCGAGGVLATMASEPTQDQAVLLAATAVSAAGAWIASTNQHARELAHAQRLARTDHLTGLANRCALITALRDALAADHSFALLLLDLDGFKAVNDTHGHRAGDQLLIAVARQIQANAGPDELAARLGGDEFVVLTTDHRPDVLLDRAAALRDDLMHLAGISPSRIRARASIGVAVREPADTRPTDLLHRADRAMYRAKREQGVAIHDGGGSATASPATYRRAGGP